MGDGVIDGVALAAGHRVLVLHNDVENGIYVVAAQGDARRAADLAVGMSGAGLTVFVRVGGESHGGRLFVCTNPETEAVVDRHPLRFVPSVEAGPGLERVSDGSSASRLTWQLRVDSTTMGLDVDGTLALRRVPGDRIVDASVPPSKLLHAGMEITVERGLQGGGPVALGGAVDVGVDFSVVPDLAAPDRGGTGHADPPPRCQHVPPSAHHRRPDPLAFTPRTGRDPFAPRHQSTGALVVHGAQGAADHFFPVVRRALTRGPPLPAICSCAPRTTSPTGA